MWVTAYVNSTSDHFDLFAKGVRECPTIPGPEAGAPHTIRTDSEA